MDQQDRQDLEFGVMIDGATGHSVANPSLLRRDAFLFGTTSPRAAKSPLNAGTSCVSRWISNA